MELTELLNSVHAIKVIGEVQRRDVSNIQYDSRRVQKNSVFVAIKGFKTDGHKFVVDAINNGAVAVVVEDDHAVPDDLILRSQIAKIFVKNSRKALAELSKGLFKNPSDKLKLIGVTGTNGKTTTSYILKYVLQNAGFKTGLIGTIANFIGDKKIDAKLTTPESNDLNLLLTEMLEENCTHAVMEVSSHSLVLHRVYGLNFTAGIFTNITSDHLDFHNTFEEYLLAKKILFDSLSDNAASIINSDDSSYKSITADCKAKIYKYGITEIADYQIKNITYDLNGTNFTVENSKNTYTIHIPLVGTFNAYNATAAFVSADILGIDKNQIVESLKTIPQVPGRFEVIGKELKKVIVDYSHTADSLEKALQAIRSIVKNDYKVVTVFGCGGDRDKTKRPVMGKIATEFSDQVYITSDNPRTEDPYAIIEDIKKGINKTNYTVIEDRGEAIKQAIINSPEKSVILIAGKGHENYQEINGVRNHFSDQEVAGKFLTK